MSPRVSTRLLGRQSDRRLLELLSQGHERAFEAIVLRYRPELLSYCRRLGLSDSRAEDAVQHALLKAWLALQGATEVRELRAWLYRIVHNTAVNVMRSSPEERVMDLDAALIEAATVPESELERSTAAREALTHVAALPPMQRHAMLLSAVEGCTHEEVASALGITHVAVRGLLYRARVTLRAAAAALTPAPLIGWGAQATSRLASSADGLAQLSAGGSADLGGMLLKGAAVTVTAALAAGAVLGPLHGHHARARPRSAPASALASAGSLRAAAASTNAAALRATGGAASETRGGQQTTLSPSRTALGRLRTHGAPVVRISPRHSASAPQRRSLTLAAVPVAGGAPSREDAASSASAPTGSAGSAGGGGEAVAEAGGGGTTPGGSEGAPTPPETGGGGGEHKTEDGGAGEREAASEKSEREAEAARERSEREAEAAREKSEREAEAARELREAEAGH